jgi:hypothetical protein
VPFGADAKKTQTRFSKMKQLALLLGKIFIFTAIPFGLAMSMCYIIPSFLLDIFALASGKEPLFVHMGWDFLIIPIGLGALFGTPMALILGLAHYFLVKQVAQGKSFDLSPIQKRTFVLKSNSRSTLQNCVLALQKFPARIVENNLLQNYITARTSTSWKSWGDDIRVDVVPIDETNSLVNIICRPALKTTLVDYGKNYGNAEKLMSLINETVKET